MTLLVANLVATLVMVGVIWIVQVVHYPLFALVGADGFVAYEDGHSRRITAVIVVPWAVEGLTALALVAAPPPGVPRWLAVAGAALAGVPVLVTLLASVPAHQVLGRGFDAAAHRRLVRTNWLRTAAWTAHGVVAVTMLVLAVDHLGG
jgi:hypothetical protein